MQASQNFQQLMRDAHDPSLVPPRAFYTFAAAATLGVIAFLAASVIFAPDNDPMRSFQEGNAVNALSAVFLAMACAGAIAVFFLRADSSQASRYFWLLMAAACLFLSLDEQLEFHERGNDLIEATSIGEARVFRNWNDVIVICYGLAALAIAWLFRREILQCRPFVILFAAAFVFYLVHTVIDSTISNRVSWKDVPEEAGKLLCGLYLCLAMLALVLSLANKRGRSQG